MKLLFPRPDRSLSRLLALSAVAFGLGILLTFFLSSRVLVIIEAFVLIAVAGLLLSEQ